jgi:hypothetical protein
VNVLRPQSLYSRKRRQAVGDPCEDCEAILVLCVQCGVDSRCLACFPYERSSARDEEEYRLRQIVRDRPQLGLLAGVFAALFPATFLWAGQTFDAPGTVRTLAALAGTVAACAFLAMGAAVSTLPLPGERSPCRMRDWTPYDRWEWTGITALLVQIILVSVGIAA